MGIDQSIILGIVQGLTELLPISSSAHLQIIPWMFGWLNSNNFVSEFQGSFDVALHFGTLLAIALFFFKDWISLIKGGYNQVVKKEKTSEGRMFWYIVLATIPGGILGYIFEHFFGDSFDLTQSESAAIPIPTAVLVSIIAIALIVMGIILYIVDKNGKNKTDYKHMTLKQTFLIGLSQALAFIPGVSRSGITMTTARAMGVKREAAAKYSFMLSAPIVLAATVLKVKDFALTSVAFWIGVFTSFVVGIFVIKFLLNYLKKGSFKAFAIYRVALGLLILGILIFRG